MKRYVVFRKNSKGDLREIDTLWMADNSDAEEVRLSLINHDRYPVDIMVARIDNRGVVLEKAEGAVEFGLGLG